MTMPIKVLYLRQAIGEGGGADTVILNCLKVLNKEQIQIVMVYLKKRNAILSLDIMNNVRALGIECYEVEGNRFFDIVQWVRILHLIRNKKIAMVHAHDPKSDAYAFLFKLFYPALKIISTIHGWTKGSSRGVFYSIIDQWLLRYFDRVIAVSKATAQAARAHYIHQVDCIPNAINMSQWLDLRERKFHCPLRIGFVGRMSPEKNPMDFVRLAQHLLPQHPQFRFVMVGDGVLWKKVQEEVYSMDLNAYFELLGAIKRDDLKKIYQEIDILVLTSLTEGLPMTILEAMAQGVLVIATNVGGVSEIIEHKKTGLLVEAKLTNQIVESILFLQKNISMAQSIRNAARQKIQNFFSIEQQILELETIYREELI